MLEELDRPALKPLPTEPYVFAEWRVRRVGIDYHVEVEGHFYSVPYRFARAEVIGHADRAGPLRDYCVGLMLPCGRKSVEPMAAVTAPGRTAAQHQSLLHFVGNAAWSDEKVLAKVREIVLPEIERHGSIEA